MSIFPLRHPILSRCVNALGMVNDPIFKKIRTQVIFKKLFTIIWLKFLNFVIKLILNHFVKRLENCGCFRFFFKEKNPSGMGTIINKTYESSTTTIRIHTRWIPKITMNDGKRNIRFFIMQRKWNTMTFRQLTNFTMKLRRF